MAKNGFKLIDAEMHVMEPVDLWQRYIDPEFADRAPRRLSERRWDIRTLVEGEMMAAMPGGDWPADRDAEEKALGDRYAEEIARDFDPAIAGQGDGQGGARPRDPVPDLGDVRHRLRHDGRALRRRRLPGLQRLALRLYRRPPTRGACSAPPRSRRTMSTAPSPRLAARSANSA